MKNPTKELFTLGVFRLFAIIAIALLIISCENKTSEKEIYLNNNDVSIEEVLDINNELNNLLEKNYSKLEESITSAKGKDTLQKNHAINYFKICLFLIKSQNNIEKTEFYFKKFINHPSTQKNVAEIDVFFKIQKCEFYIVSNERRKARLLLDEILNFVNIDHNFNLYYHAKYIEAKVLCNEYQYTKGIEVLLSVYEAVKKNPDIKLNKYLILNNLALYLNEMSKYDQAMEYLTLALKELKNTNKLNELYLTYSNIGNILGDQKKHQAAIDTLLKSVEINKKLNRRSNSIITYYNIGRSYTDLGNYAKANQYFLIGLDQTKELGFEIGYSYLYFGLGNNYYKSKEYARALNYLNKAVDYCRKMDNKAILFNSIKNIIEIAKINNDAQTVLKYLDEYETLQEEYHKYVLNEQVEEMVLKMDVEKINSKNKLLSQEVALNEKINQKQTLLIYTETTIVVFILISIFLLYRSNKKKQRINQQLATQKIEIENSNKNLIRLIADRDNLVKTIIHDLRNPLSAIKGCANLMVEEVDENEKEVLLNMMNSSANRLDMLISSLLNSYTADDNNLHDNQLVKTNLDNFVKNIVENFEFEAKLKNIELHTYLEPIKLKVNQNALFSVVGNLISNAIKYSPKNTAVKLSLLNEEQQWKIIITDQGPGFAKEDLDKMFQLQTTLSSSPTGNEISTGIGLYSIKKTVERYRGTVELNQDYKNGAEFIIIFPKEKN